MKRKTVYTLLLILIVLSFFITPLGDFAKSGLMRLFASTPDIITIENQEQLSSYDWRLRDADGNNFNFERSKGKVAFIDFWATWHTPSTAELRDIQKLYDDYSGKVDFYMVTNEAQFPVEEFMVKTDYSFPVTFRSMDEPSPLEVPDPSGTYLIDKTGSIVVKSKKMTDWYNQKVTQLLDSLVLK